MSVSLREASRRTGRDPHYIKGRSEGMRIPLERVGPSLVMTDADFRRLCEAMVRDGYQLPEAAMAS